MKKRNWREVAEVVSVVAGLILVAWEIRQANNIAKAQMVLDLATQANEFNSSRFKSRDVAELAAAMSDPDHTDFTETQESMMAGVLPGTLQTSSRLRKQRMTMACSVTKTSGCTRPACGGTSRTTRG